MREIKNRHNEFCPGRLVQLYRRETINHKTNWIPIIAWCKSCEQLDMLPSERDQIDKMLILFKKKFEEQGL